MSCPICSGSEEYPEDASVVEKRGRRVAVRGKVYAIIPPNHAYSPYKHYATVSLYPRKGPVIYIKLKTMEEVEKWPFARGWTLIVEGCLHVVDGKQLIFDVTAVYPPTDQPPRR